MGWVWIPEEGLLGYSIYSIFNSSEDPKKENGLSSVRFGGV